MKAFISEKYGPPGMLRMAEVEMPAPGAGEVLVKVQAMSVNPAAWHSMGGKPLFSRAALGLWRPKHKILGVAHSAVMHKHTGPADCPPSR